MAFDGNAYRKGVLAPIEARGGVPASDPFEWYDLPLENDLKDSAVRSQIDSVWAFWQKQREAPKYRGLILALLARHEEVAPLLWDKRSRRELADVVRRERAERVTDRFSELDAAIGRLVERFGGIPASKVPGLLAFAGERDISEPDARERISRHPVAAEQARAGAVDPYKRARADLEELGRLMEGTPFPSLFVFLDLPPTANTAEVRRARDRIATRNRELLPDRRRALVDDLLAAVTALLVDGDPQTYLSALAVDVTDALRPRFQAAVLVEDVLTADDAAYLVTAAEELGLDDVRARDVVVALAREAGVAMPAAARRPQPTTSTDTVPEGYRRAPKEQAPASAWHDELAAARAALRAGRAKEAQRRVETARSLAGGTTPPVRAVADEVDAVLAEAAGLWAQVEQALAGRQLARVLAALERLQRIASDVPSPQGRLAADLLAETAQAADPPAPPAALQVTLANGGVTLTWAPSPDADVEYRVVAIGADGSRRVLGTTRGCELETAAPRGEQPSYAVQARRAGVLSEEVTVTAAPAAPPPVLLDLPAVTGLQGGERLTWTWPDGCTEVRVVWRPDAPPEGPDDPAATGKKVTNTKYEIDGGFPRPLDAGHVAVFTCARVDGNLLVAQEAPASARLTW